MKLWILGLFALVASFYSRETEASAIPKVEDSELVEMLQEALARIKVLEEGQSSMKETVTDVKLDVTFLKQSLLTVQTEYATLVSVVFPLERDVSDLTAEVLLLNGTVTSLEGQIGHLPEFENLTSLITDVQTLKSDVGDLKKEVGELPQNISTLQHDVDQLKVNVDDLHSLPQKISEIEKDVRTLESEVIVLNTLVPAIEVDVLHLKEVASNTSSSLNSVRAELVSIQDEDKVGTLANRVKSLEDGEGGSLPGFQELKAEVADIKDETVPGSIANKLSTLSTTLTNIQDPAAPDSLAYKIQSNNIDISSLENQVGDETTPRTILYRVYALEAGYSIPGFEALKEQVNQIQDETDPTSLAGRIKVNEDTTMDLKRQVFDEDAADTLANRVKLLEGVGHFPGLDDLKDEVAQIKDERAPGSLANKLKETTTKIEALAMDYNTELYDADTFGTVAYRVQELESIVSDVGSKIVPVGFIYFQPGGEKDPEQLWPPADKWKIVDEVENIKKWRKIN